MDLNQVVLIGTVDASPELKFMANGRAMCRMRVVTMEEWKQGNEKKTRKAWHGVVAWGSTAEACAPSVKKGTRVFVRGRIESRSYDDGSGARRWITEIIAEQLHAIGQVCEADSEPPEEDLPF